MVTPHQVAAVLAGGELEPGATILHDCELRLCCRTDPVHVRVATQGENMRQAARRGRAVGPRPGLVDVRGKVGASRAVQTALRTATDRTGHALAVVLAEEVAAGDPRAGIWPLFEVDRSGRSGPYDRPRSGRWAGCYFLRGRWLGCCARPGRTMSASCCTMVHADR